MRPILIAVMQLSWGIALFEYLLQVPANRIGYTSTLHSRRRILHFPQPLGRRVNA
jgi:hypothetical protein